MNRLPEFDPIIQIISQAKGGVIFLPENPSLDPTAASLSLFLSLEKSGKNFGLVCSTPMTVGLSKLVGVNKISGKIGGRSLVISFDYLENAIDKVSYNIENKKFNLVVQPKTGFPPLSIQNVNYSYSGDLEVVVVIGSDSLDNLGPIYRQEKKVFEQTQIINIDINSTNTRFGKVNAIFSDASSYSEIMAALLQSANYPVDQDIASNLLFGIQGATGNFTAAKTTAEAFEAVAFCLRSGARRQALLARQNASSFRKPSPVPLSPMTKDESAARPPQISQITDQVAGANTDMSATDKKMPKSPSADWYGPKVFRGSQRV
ncbi:MAG TPA: hypothetical protein VMW41_01330 [Candidatus Bathyarchaeia archaeon]|nr:hypothetical protein [Candidatus Bathyarchaeia archaeon]